MPCDNAGEGILGGAGVAVADRVATDVQPRCVDPGLEGTGAERRGSRRHGVFELRRSANLPRLGAVDATNADKSGEGIRVSTRRSN